ncbi:MAG: GNAT family N-acetyltransferase [Oscillospiraceae bacterium]
MEIRQITENKKQFLQLLLLADEQEDMIDRYLSRGELFALYDPFAPHVRAVCVVTLEAPGVYEIKNLATVPRYQRRGYARGLIEFLFSHYRRDGKTMLVGTGESPLTLPFYEKCGFRFSHRIPNFFTEHYDHPIYEDGVLLRDMVVLRREFPR